MPSFYYRITYARIMREMGYIDCTPNNIQEYDNYDVQAALMMFEMENDPQLKKAREQANKRRNSTRAKGGAPKGNRSAASHLSLVRPGPNELPTG